MVQTRLIWLLCALMCTKAHVKQIMPVHFPHSSAPEPVDWLRSECYVNAVGRPVKYLLVLARTVILGFRPRRELRRSFLFSSQCVRF
jgi:hypothetical protein